MAEFQEHYDFGYFTSEDSKTFQPKQKNRFAILIRRLPAAVENSIEYDVTTEKYAKRSLLLGLQSFKRPDYSVNVVEIPNFNDTFLYPGKDNSSKTITATFIDSYAFAGGVQTLSPASIIYRWYMLVNDKNYNSIGYKDYFSTDINLYTLFPTGQVAEYWRYYEVWPTAVDFGEVSYEGDDFISITVTFRYQTARLVSETVDQETSAANIIDGLPEHVYRNTLDTSAGPTKEIPINNT